MSITANLQRNRTVVGSVSQGNQPQVTRVQTPGQTITQFQNLRDVDASNLQDGALIQYDGGSEKFVVTNVIETETGEIRLNGGVF